MASGEAPDYYASSWRDSPRYGSRDQGQRRFNSSTADREHTDSWVGRSNYEVGFGGWGRNKYDRGSYDPYWSHDQEDHARNDRGWFDRASDEVASWFGDDEAERRREMDSRRGSNFRGRGPKGYTRSDDRIREDINDRLTDDYALDASEIEVSVDGGDVVLSGTVDSRFDKRRAEDIAEMVSGVRNVENRVRVSERDHSGWGSRSSEYDTSHMSTGYSDGATENRTRTAGGSA
jgi:osmotically-inducible protein OsmY